MARYKGTVTSPHPAEDVWRYLADLRSVEEWDPSVEEIRLVSGEPGTVGARYELEVGFLGRRVALPYVIAQAESPSQVIFAAETDSVTVRDVATVRATPDGGTAVTWDADLRLKGARRLFDPILRLGFSRLGSRASQGLEEKLNQPAPPRERAKVPA